MVRIGKDVTFDGSRNTIGELFIKWLPLRPEVGVQDPPSLTFLSDNQLRIYGWDTDLTDLKQRANNKGFVFNIDGDAPAEPVIPEDPQPTPDEVTALAEMKQAFENARIAEQDRIWALVEAEYDLIKTTAEPFRRFTDIKYLRGL